MRYCRITRRFIKRYITLFFEVLIILLLTISYQLKNLRDILTHLYKFLNLSIHTLAKSKCGS